jgi:class 3 adenylate cyclase
LKPVCPACGAENEPGEKFCGECGAAFAVNAVPVATSSTQAVTTVPNIRSAPEQRDASTAIDGERKTVTALFADIKGSTELMEELDPEEARAIVDPALKLMIEEVRRYHGYVVQSTGDGIFALFGAPVAHEDHPQRALYAALRMQDELRGYSAKLVAKGGTPVEARIGATTGEVVVRSIQTGGGHTEYAPIGHTANLASRMQAVAPTGSIAISEQTRRLVEGYFQLKGLGPTRVKGVSEPVEVYEVTGLGPLRTRLQRAAGRGLTKFVGREREMEALKHAAALARQGSGQIVAAMAEPGVGKSRLFFEFKATSQTGWMVLEAFSASHGKATAYLSVIDLLRNYFDIAPADDERKRRERVAGKITILDRSLEDTLPYLFTLLGIVEGEDPLAQMDGQIRKRRTLEAIKRIVLRESLNQPLMVIFEDLHWIDEQTQELLNLLADSIGTTKILLLVNYRPEYSDQWGSKTYYTQLRLDPLCREGAHEMLTAMVGDGKEVRSLKGLIIERTGGNPFFMEEIVQSLFEEGVLQRDNPHPDPLPDTLSWRADAPPSPAKEAGEGSKEGSYREGEGSKGREQRIGVVKLAKPMRAVKVPATVQAILASRIDRLPAEEKELLQTLAVFGREFALSLVRRVFDGRKNDELERMLADLQMAEFIYEQLATGDIEYIFKHALTQEVAYNSLLIERRKLLHERAGAALESMFAEQMDDHLGDLAHHYSHSEDVEKAVEYLGRAGHQAIQRSANAEAVNHLTSAVEILKTLPDTAQRAEQELVLLTMLGPALKATKGNAAPEVGAVYKRALELAGCGKTSISHFGNV